MSNVERKSFNAHRFSRTVMCFIGHVFQRQVRMRNLPPIEKRVRNYPYHCRSRLLYWMASAICSA